MGSNDNAAVIFWFVSYVDRHFSKHYYGKFREEPVSMLFDKILKKQNWKSFSEEPMIPTWKKYL